MQEYADNGELTVEYVQIPDGWPGMTQKLNAAIAAGSVPDVAGIKDFSMKEYAWRGAVLSLDDYFATGELEPSRFRSSIWDAMHYDGVAYGAPWPGSFVHVLFINNDLFEAAGLDPVADAPTNWTELQEVSQTLTKPDGEQYGHTFYELGTREYNLMMFSVYTGQCGGQVFSEDRTRVTLDTPEATEAMQWMHDMLWKWQVALPVDLMESRWDLVRSGIVGTWNAGPWFIWDLRANAPQLNWSLTQWPCNTTCDNVDAPECLVILKDAKDPDLSWQGIKLLINPEFDLELSPPRGSLPVFEENLDKGAYAEDPPFIKYAEIARNPELRPRAWVEGYEDVASVITPELQAVWFDQKGVAEGLASAEAFGNEAMARILSSK
jgi:multiple sugar transport system substrate-binding protein